ncbi:MAG: beta-lactamase family protein [Phycisphaerales bacterium]|nr:beta-lactamase family protein [Phycisphaerales bacterium]
MINRFTLLAVCLLVPLVGASVDADDDAPIKVGEKGEKIAAFAAGLDEQGFSGVVLAALDAKVIAAQGVGFADTAKTIPNTPGTLFEIASLSKQFTAAGLLRLAQDGVLTLDDPLHTRLPGVPDDCKAITLRHLLQHTSGIPGANSRGSGFDLERVLPSFLRGGPRHTPGTHWEYWNQGYALAAEVMTQTSGRDFPDSLKVAIFRRAGLHSACFTGDAVEPTRVVSVGQSVHGPARGALEHPYGEFGFQYRGMGGVVISAMDLWRWDRSLETDAVLDAKAREAFFTPGPGNYALGWFVRTNEKGRLTQSHGGGVRGFVCEMRRFPSHQACIIVLANRDDAPVRDVANAIEQILFDEPLTWLSPPDEKFSRELVGDYESTARPGVMLLISLHGNAVQAWIDWSGRVTRGKIGLDGAGGLVFSDSRDQTKVTLSRDANGVVVSIALGELMTFTRKASHTPETTAPR